MNDDSKDKKIDGVVLSHDRPMLIWVLVLLFAVVGLAFVVLGGRHIGTATWLEDVAAMLMGFFALMSGAYAARQAETITVTANEKTQRIHVQGKFPWRTRHACFAFEDIDKAELETTKDSDGDPVWRPVMVMKDGAPIALIAGWSHDKEKMESICAALQSVLKR